MKRSYFLIVLLIGMMSCRGSYTPSGNAAPPSHQIWDDLLQTHVSEEGWVDYKGFQRDSARLKAYLDELTSHPPAKKWSREASMAYWINAYNAFTVEIVRRNYPVESIKDINPSISLPFVNTVWDIRFIEIKGKSYDLNNIEHKILRKKYGDPRIHFAVNCASYSCPKLLNEAYSAERLDEQLDEQAHSFINDGVRNRLSKDTLHLSKIFSWYKGDFTEDGTLKDYLRKYSDIDFSDDANIEFLDYDWTLNAQP